MTDEIPRVQLHDARIAGDADPAALQAAIERAVARTLGEEQTQRDTKTVRDAIATEILGEVHR